MIRPLVAALLLPALAAAAQPPESRDAPATNVVLIVADDLGYRDLGCYGSTDIRTPHLDNLAEEGLRFTSFYANSCECTPTRTALLTGRYQQRAGGLECAIGLDNVGRYDDAIQLAEAGRLGLPPSASVIPGAFKQRGYNTAMIGKWHLGDGRDFHPNRHGFDLFIGAAGGAIDYFHHTEPKGIFLGNPIAGDPDFFRNGKPLDRRGEYLTELISAEASAWIDKQTKDRPFFLYLPYTAPHAPYQTPVSPHPQPLTTDDWNKGSRDAYVAMVESLDKGIGRILKALESGALAERTLVIFFSDNGPAKHGDPGTLRGRKGQLFEGGIKVPCIVRWPGRIPPGITSSQPAISMDLTASLVSLTDHNTSTLDGIDILQHVITRKPDLSRKLFWRKRRGTLTWKAARDGDFKFVRKEDSAKPPAEEYLFDLAVDPDEQNDLSRETPDRLQALKILLTDWEKEVKADR